SGAAAVAPWVVLWVAPCELDAHRTAPTTLAASAARYPRASTRASSQPRVPASVVDRVAYHLPPLAWAAGVPWVAPSAVAPSEEPRMPPTRFRDALGAA